MRDTEVDTEIDGVTGQGNESAEHPAPGPTGQPVPDPALPEVPPGLGRDLALYTLARFGFIAVIAVVLVFFGVPLVAGVAVGLVVAFPLSMVLLRGWHTRVAAGLAARGAVRRAARERLRAELRGELAEDAAPPAARGGTGDDERTTGS